MDRPKPTRGPRPRPQPFSLAARNETPQQTGRRKEREFAKEIGGELQPGSGCFPGKGGDVKKAQYLIEHKYTTALSYTVTIKTLRKIRLESEHQNRRPALVIEMSGGFMVQAEKWVLVPFDEFERLLE